MASKMAWYYIVFFIFIFSILAIFAPDKLFWVRIKKVPGDYGSKITLPLSRCRVVLAEEIRRRKPGKLLCFMRI